MCFHREILKNIIMGELEFPDEKISDCEEDDSNGFPPVQDGLNTIFSSHETDEKSPQSDDLTSPDNSSSSVKSPN